MRPHWRDLLALPWALPVTQEAQTFEGESLVRAARKDGMDVALSPSGHDSSSLLAVFARLGRLVVREPPPEVGAAHVPHLLWTLPSLGFRVKGLTTAGRCRCIE